MRRAYSNARFSGPRRRWGFTPAAVNVAAAAPFDVARTGRTPEHGSGVTIVRDEGPAVGAAGRDRRRGGAARAAADAGGQPTNTPSGSDGSENGASGVPGGLPPERLRPGNRVRVGGNPGPLPATRSRVAPPVTPFTATRTPPRLALSNAKKLAIGA